MADAPNDRGKQDEVQADQRFILGYCTSIANTRSFFVPGDLRRCLGGERFVARRDFFPNNY
jgi:hypothetical protein